MTPSTAFDCGVQVLPLTPESFPSVVSLHLLQHPPYRQLSADRLYGYTHLWPKRGYVAVDVSRRLVGYLLLHFLSSVHVRVIDLVVKEEWRRKGVATMLLLPLLRRASVGPLQVDAVVRENNLEAQLHLRHVGFRYQQTLPSFYHDRHGDPVHGYLLSYQPR